jgi:hypothetical protein
METMSALDASFLHGAVALVRVGDVEGARGDQALRDGSWLLRTGCDTYQPG